MENVGTIEPSDVRGRGGLEAVSLAKILGSGNESVALFTKQLDHPLTNEQIEKLLSNQAIVLNAIGNREIQLSVDIGALEGKTRELADNYRNSAFKALELSRKCLVALNEMRSPKKSATFIKNQIAQQVNQLQLGESHAPQMDGRTASKTARIDPELATLDEIDGR